MTAKELEKYEQAKKDFDIATTRADVEEGRERLILWAMRYGDWLLDMLDDWRRSE